MNVKDIYKNKKLLQEGWWMMKRAINLIKKNYKIKKRQQIIQIRKQICKICIFIYFIYYVCVISFVLGFHFQDQNRERFIKKSLVTGRLFFIVTCVQDETALCKYTTSYSSAPIFQCLYQAVHTPCTYCYKFM